MGLHNYMTESYDVKNCQYLIYILPKVIKYK